MGNNNEGSDTTEYAALYHELPNLFLLPPPIPIRNLLFLYSSSGLSTSY